MNLLIVPPRLMKSLLVPIGILALSSVAEAQTFTVEPASGPGPFTITWDSQGGTNCQAAGIADWTGAVGSSGTKSVRPAVGTKNLSLACTLPGLQISDITLSWLAPTENTDGTPLTDLAGYVIFSGKTDPPTSQTTINDATALKRVVPNLSAGKWFFGIKAKNAAGTLSDLSGIVAKDVPFTGPTRPWSATATIEVTPPPPKKPKAPVLSAD